MPTSLSFLDIHRMSAEPAENFTGDVGIVHRWGYNEPGDDGEAVYRRVRNRPTAHWEWFERNGNFYEMIGNGSGLSMRAFGLFAVHDFHSSVDVTPYLDRAHAHGLATGFRRWRWPAGYYRCDTRPHDINFPGAQHIGDPAGMSLLKNFRSSAGQVGVINFRSDASHGLLKYIGIASLPGSQDANGIGTGCLASIEPPPGTQANKITIDHCNLTGRVSLGQAGTMHGIVANGTHGNTASSSRVRGLQIIDTDIFGVEQNGWALLLWGCSNVNVKGGGITSSGGKRAKTFIASWAGEGRASQNIHFAPNGASEVELSNAHHVTLNSPTYEGLVSRDGSTSHITGLGHAKGGLSPGFVSGDSTWQGKVGP